MDQQDVNLILLLAAAGPCSLDSSPKKNWVEKSGGLPNYICHIAKGIMKSGKSKSQAISIAVSRVKAWAAGGDDVDADTRAKAVKAVAEWEALKAKNGAKQLVKASREDGTSYIMLSNAPSYSMEQVNRAWNVAQDKDWMLSDKQVDLSDRGYIQEMWSDHFIVGYRDHSERVPYEVTRDGVVFGTATVVEQKWVESEESVLNAAERALLHDVISAGNPSEFLATIRQISGR